MAQWSYVPPESLEASQEFENQKFPVKSIISPQIINGFRFAIPKNINAINAIQKITPAIPQFITSTPFIYI